jgi:hypothetical protein
MTENIVAMLNLSSGLSRVPAEGGVTVPLKIQKKRDDEIDRWPQALPGS